MPELEPLMAGALRDGIRRPLGLAFVCVFCFLRAFAETWEALRLWSYHQIGFSRAIDTYFFLLDGAVWMMIGLGLWLLWKHTRLIAVTWSAVVILWASHGMLTPSWTLPPQKHLYFVVMGAQIMMIAYLSSKRIKRLFAGAS